MRQVDDEEIRLLLDTIDDDNGFAKICLRMTCGWASGTNISRVRRSCSRT